MMNLEALLVSVDFLKLAFFFLRKSEKSIVAINTLFIGQSLPSKVGNYFGDALFF